MNIAELNSRVFIGFEDFPPEWIPLPLVHNASVQVLNVLSTQAKFSNVNSVISLSDEFTPTDNSPYNITNLIGKGLPSWIEYKANETTWIPIRVVDLSVINSFYNLGALVVAFYGEDTGEDGADVVQYAKFSNIPNAACRIRFDRDNVQNLMQDVLALPDNLSDYPVLLAQNKVIPRIKTKIALNLNRNENERKDAQLLIGLLNDIWQQNMLDIQPLKALYNIWAFSERPTHKNFNKPTPKSRTLYGGRFNW